LYGLEVSQQITGRFFSPITIKLGWYPNVTFTLMLVIGGLYVARILRQAVLQGDIYKMAQKPFQISIAGDSGVGKDTLASGLVEIFGRDNSVLISGDNYHKYERDDHVWGKITHLNPEANNISKWSNDLQNAFNRTTFSQRYYDHEFGKFTDDMHHTKADLVVSQGLHGLYPELTLNSDVCVYLEMEEKLRVALKIARDSGSRQRTVAEVRRQLRQRGEDASRYILTQVLIADLHVMLSQASVKEGEYFVDLRFSDSVQFEEFSKSIAHFSNVGAHEIVDSTGRKWLRVKSEEFNSDEAIALLQSTMKDFDQIFPRCPEFPSGSEGVICTAVLFLVDRKR
jgi:uridine kinase